MSDNNTEIERAWVIKKLPTMHQVKPASYHEIGYLLTTNPKDKTPGELRVFRKGNPDWEYGITVKNMGDMYRNEWEGRLFPEWAFDVLWDHTKSARVFKTRFYSSLHSFEELLNDSSKPHLLFEIDVYEGKLYGLIRVECEFSSVSEAEDFELPSMMGKAVEVTTDKRFKNSKLAQLSRKEYQELINELG